MHFSNFTKIAVLSTALVLQARGGSSFPKINTGDFEVIQTTTVTSSRLQANFDIPTVPPFVPSAADLVVNTTAVPQGESAFVGWVFPAVGNNTAVFDGSSLNVSAFYTPPGGVEQFLFSLAYGPDAGESGGAVGFCGFNPGLLLAAVLNSSDPVGNYTGR
ncbi:hypothetical protein K438DRAFT_1838930 [Mycena galopus ATCC 62051]|nr:hypothetical protein K438DRAFT_1838930 [Mycena galopus ATCC 62051]